MSRILLADDIALVFMVEESETVNGAKKLRGLFHLAETKNANQRIYPRKLLEREMKRIMPAISERRILGEINHPMDPQINLEKSSHVITSLKMEGNKVFGELESLKTPAGKILEGLIDSGIRLGISSRGLGSLKKTDEGINVVQEDYGLITWDVVANPSTPEAWLGESAIYSQNVKENKQNKTQNDSNIEVFQNTDKISLEMLIRDGMDQKFGGNK